MHEEVHNKNKVERYIRVFERFDPLLKHKDTSKDIQMNLGYAIDINTQDFP
jgi:hypothetical protein